MMRFLVCNVKTKEAVPPRRLCRESALTLMTLIEEGKGSGDDIIEQFLLQ